jgi:hypothetical protein
LAAAGERDKIPQTLTLLLFPSDGRFAFWGLVVLVTIMNMD